jgi:hypothetical protein
MQPKARGMNALTLTPRQAYEVSRLLDRHGHGLVYGGEGVVTVLLDIYRDGLTEPCVGAPR